MQEFQNWLMIKLVPSFKLQTRHFYFLRAFKSLCIVLNCRLFDFAGAYLDEPKRDTRFGLLKVFLTVITGLSIGAWVSQKMAAFLEENELFVPEDDDDDDDDDD